MGDVHGKARIPGRPALLPSDHWVARTGFTMFWLGNGTAATDQLSVNNLFSDDIVTGIDNGANVFLYGLNLGLEAGW